ncbi:MAG: hypothetical protein ABJO01_13575 [Parasphingorhabdus sp.]|uniref:Gldg family protein n=1 Tax=Parasphingorhabdus sp. TaxID=2709688 RepID=UPI003297672D
MASPFLLLAVAGLLLQCSPASTGAPKQETARAKITMMTSLPIIWGEAVSMEAVISGEANPAAIYSHWQEQHDIVAVDSFEALEKSSPDIILLAQPPAMDPADIATVDKWVRAGGRALIFTDPMLDWHTIYALGDKRRPLASGLLSPLLNHWGLQLEAPSEQGEGQVELEFSDIAFTTVGIGALATLPDKNTANDQPAPVKCEMSAANFIAHCHIGKGRAIIVADADFLNDSLWDQKPQNDTGDARKWVDILIDDLQKP